MATDKKVTILVNAAFKMLYDDLILGDEVQTSGSSDRPIRMSKKTGEARVKFINNIRNLLVSKELSVEDANKATQLFGKKTSDLFWCKKTIK